MAGVYDSMRAPLLALSFLFGLLAAPLAADESAVMKRGVTLFTDRNYVIDEMPDAVKDLPFHRTSIEKLDVTVTKPGTLFALTPTIRPQAASQEEALQKAGSDPLTPHPRSTSRANPTRPPQKQFPSRSKAIS